MPFLLDQPQRSLCPAYLALAPILTPELCALTVQHYGKLMSISPAREVSSGYDFATLRWHKEAAWLFRLLCQAVEQARNAYPFAYSGFSEPLLLMRFDGRKNSGHGWQMDCGRGSTSNRKLTLTVELSDPSEYEGGELEVHGPDGVRASEKRQRGEVYAWPAYAVHRTLPVTWGERWALRAHLTGPAFV